MAVLNHRPALLCGAALALLLTVWLALFGAEGRCMALAVVGVGAGVLALRIV